MFLNYFSRFPLFRFRILGKIQDNTQNNAKIINFLVIKNIKKKV